jgi:hypothetical protein
MIVPAWTERARLAAAMLDFERGSRWRSFYQSSSRDEGTVDTDDWNRIQRVSVDADGAIVGYLSARVDRDVRRVRELCAIAFVEHSVTWAIDVRSFVRGLVAEFEAVHWSAIADTPNAAMYRRAVELHGGRVVGRFSRAGRRPGGQIVDVEWYELIGHVAGRSQ